MTFSSVKSPLFGRQLTLSLDAVVEAFRSARDPRVELDRFSGALISAVRARQHTLGGVSSDRLHFAANVLLPFRLRNSQRYLDPASVSASALAGFLEIAAELAVADIEVAASADGIADPLIAAVDNLHSYLLAHRLVGNDYEAAERAFADRVAHDDVPTPTDGHDPSPVPAGADHDLALAA
jgi:hypothetical protein